MPPQRPHPGLARARAPWLRRAGPVLFLVALAVLTRLPGFGFSVLDWDESLYVLVAEGWRAGHLPYTGIWDNKPLGIYAILAACQTVFGDDIASMRLAGLGAAAATAVLIHLLVRRIGGPRAGACGVLAGSLYLLLSLVDDGMASNTELFMVGFTSLGMWLALDGRGRGRALGAGLALGAAVMLKYVAVFDAPVVLLALLRHRAGRPSRVLLFTAGMAAPPASALALYGLAGSLAAFWQVSLLSYLARAGAPFSPAAMLRAFRAQALLCLPVSLAPLLMLIQAVRGRGAGAYWLLLGWTVADAAGACVGGFFYSHYFLQMLPPLCVATGVLAATLVPGLAAGTRPVVIACAMAALVALPVMQAWRSIAPMLPVLAEPPSLGPLRDEPARMAADLLPALAGAPGATIYVFDAQPVLYSLTKTVPPTRYAFPSYLLSRLLSRVAGVVPGPELARIMGTAPLFVVRAEPPHGGFAGGISPGLTEALDAALARSYRPWRRYRHSLVYRRIE